MHLKKAAVILTLLLVTPCYAEDTAEELHKMKLKYEETRHDLEMLQMRYRRVSEDLEKMTSVAQSCEEGWSKSLKEIDKLKEQQRVKR